MEGIPALFLKISPLHTPPWNLSKGFQTLGHQKETVIIGTVTVWAENVPNRVLFEHLVFSYGCYLGRMGDLQEVGSH